MACICPRGYSYDQLLSDDCHEHGRIKKIKELMEAQRVDWQTANARVSKPRCLDCNAAGHTNCSHFDNCSGKWVYDTTPPVKGGVR
jgi:hypothetical protein